MSDWYTNQESSSFRSKMQILKETLGKIRNVMWAYEAHEFTHPKEKERKRKQRQPIDPGAETLRELGINFRKLHPKLSSGLLAEPSGGSGLSLGRLQHKSSRQETLKEIERLHAVLESQNVTLLIAMQ
ncbi:integral membrane protein [Colletotrichum graminicola]|nr:integral membrane protein [Colletotrichum graminicola]